MPRIRVIMLVLLVTLWARSVAEEPMGDIVPLHPAAVDTAATPHRSFVGRVIDYFRLDADPAAVDTSRTLRLSFLGGPSYESVSGLNLSVSCVATYRHAGCTSASLQPSNAKAYAYVSTRGFWSVGLRGTSILAGDRRRFCYELFTEYAPRDFWGIGYDLCATDSLRTSTRQQNVRANAELLWQVSDNLYAGPALRFDYSDIGRDDLRDRLWGQAPEQHSVGMGLTVQCDSRDLMTNASRGVYLNLTALYRPAFLGNHSGCMTISTQLDGYFAVWRDAVLAADLRGTFIIGHPSWAMLPLLGDSYSMRGYYEGRFRDRHLIAGQVELRQRVYRRSGIVVWGGAGAVFADASGLRHWLPNVGIGYRWEFRRRTNIRLDYGFGSHGQHGAVFAINEAF